MFNVLTILFITAWYGYAEIVLARSFSDDEEYVDYAQVIASEPIYETVQVIHPVRECWNEEVEYRRGGESATGAIAGGVVGGVIGHQFGRGSGRAAMTMVGTLLGATVGRDLDGPERRVIADERHCEIVDRYTEEKRLVGYRVTYRYKGKNLVTRTETEPGDTIPVRVAIEPLP